MQAAVIFTNDSRHWLASRLRAGYKHVFCALPSVNADDISVQVDLSIKGIEVLAVKGAPEQVADVYRAAGLEAILVPYRPTDRVMIPVIANSCVGLTKQLIGLRCAALTPWQLRQALLKETM